MPGHGDSGRRSASAIPALLFRPVSVRGLIGPVPIERSLSRENGIPAALACGAFLKKYF
jgi:hypothetical protein